MELEELVSLYVGYRFFFENIDNVSSRTLSGRKIINHSARGEVRFIGLSRWILAATFTHGQLTFMRALDTSILQFETKWVNWVGLGITYRPPLLEEWTPEVTAFYRYAFNKSFSQYRMTRTWTAGGRFLMDTNLLSIPFFVGHETAYIRMHTGFERQSKFSFLAILGVRYQI